MIRNAHDPAQAQIGQTANLLRERHGVLRRDAGLCDCAINVDLNAHLQRHQGCRALLAQTLGDPEPIDRMHPVEVLGDQARLVALDGADAMPLQRQVPQGMDLLYGFL